MLRRAFYLSFLYSGVIIFLLILLNNSHVNYPLLNQLGLLLFIMVLVDLYGRNLFFRFYVDYCKYGVIVRRKTRYENVKAIFISDKFIRTNYSNFNQFSIASYKKNLTVKEAPILNAYISLHNSDEFSSLLQTENIFIATKFEKSVLIRHDKNIDSDQIVLLKNYLTGFTFKDNDFSILLQKSSGPIYLKRSTYEAQQASFDRVFNNANIADKRIIIIQDTK